jgi:glucosyl-dolichyl phosphate glucuronosyltransferase
MNVSVTIIICTRNRAQSLRATLQAMNSVVLPAGISGELLVVDNGSEDDTREVVQAAKVAAMPVRYVVERMRGLSHARNRGLDESRGRVILFTDDDVRPAPTWAGAMCSPIIEGVADAVQGMIRIPESLRKPWMQRFHSEMLASTESFTQSHIPYLAGANMAFGRHVLKQVPQFDPELGAGAIGFAEDGLFSMQLCEARFTLRLVESAVVDHHFDASRLTSGAFRDRAIRDGRSRAYVSHHWLHESFTSVDARLRSLRVRVWRHAIRKPWGYLSSAVMTEADFWLYIQLGFWEQLLIEQQRPRRYAQRGLSLLESAALAF